MNSNTIILLLILLLVILSILIFITIPILIYIIKENRKNEEIKEENNIIYYQQEIKNPYHKVRILTDNEMNFYRKLKEITLPSGYGILTKIRLADLINVNNNISKSEYYSYFGKIKSKHIDFAVHWNMEIVCLIELDDQTHQRADRAERDRFVDDVLTKTGYTIIHTYGEVTEVYNTICRYANKAPL